MTDEDVEDLSDASRRRRAPERHWGNIAAGFSAACALAVSAYTAYLQRQQVKAQVWPILAWGLSATIDDGGDQDGGAGGMDGGELEATSCSSSACGASGCGPGAGPGRLASGVGLQ